MVLSEDTVRQCTRKLLLSRFRLLLKQGFYALLLMHAKFALDENCSTAGTDGEKIYFNPAWLLSLSDAEVDFILMHETLHIALQHVERRSDREDEQFNRACDIVVNSHILASCGGDEKAITLHGFGVAPHLTPNGREGADFTVEQVYDMLSLVSSPNPKAGLARQLMQGGKTQNCPALSGSAFRDDHSRWGTQEDPGQMREQWYQWMQDACQSLSIRDPDNSCGTLPAFAKRWFDDLRNPKTDWRTLLNDFVQEEITDYSFAPPDRRFDDSPFFLPDFNVPEEKVEDILFMVDTSGSMSDGMITAAFSEIKGAIDQFGGHLRGWLGFFDAEVTPPLPFEDVDSLKEIAPQGGGGTSFSVIFEYVAAHMQQEPPSSIIILTDGYANFPEESAAMGIPVLWLLNNEEITPPWGKIARVEM